MSIWPKICLLLIATRFLAADLWAQGITITGTAVPNRLLKQVQTVADSALALQLVTDWCQLQKQEGFLECEIRTVAGQYPNLRVDLYKGKQYRYGTIKLEGLNPLYKQKTGLDRLEQKEAPFSWEAFEQRLFDCVDLFQQEGYPFAAFERLNVAYDSSTNAQIKVHLHYQFQAGPVIKIDSIFVRGNPREKDEFIYSLIRLYPGDHFQQKRIDDIPRILNNSIYYQNVAQPKVSFTADEAAHLYIDLERKKAGKFDLLLGILPPNNTTPANQRLQFTGTVDVVLVSPLKQGEWLEFKFDKLTAASQQTQLKLILPYLFRTPLRLEGAFDLFKQDEDFLNLNSQAGGRYAFSPFLSAQFFYKGQNTRLIGEALSDTSLSRLAQVDGSRQSAGVGFQYQNLDYRLNPSRGWDMDVSVSLGRKVIRQNINLNPELYDGIPSEQNIQEVQLELGWYYSLIPRHVIHLANETRWLGMDYILRNDQWQLGGAQSIRGFNENLFFADFYSFFTAEYRLQLERNSYLFLFGDFAWLRNSEQQTEDQVFGTGIGMNYGTRAGIISISYAVGQSRDIPFQPTRGRIHIGLINQF